MDNSVMDNTATDDMNQAPVVVNESPAQDERVFKQSELDRIVGRAKHEAVESFKHQQAQKASNQGVPAQQQYANNGLSEDDVKRLTSEELNRQREEWEKTNLERQHAESAKRIVSQYQEKIAPGRDKYQDFEAVTANVDMRYYPNVVQLLAEHVDNAADVFYDLARNRSKLYQIESACQHNPQDAIYEIQRLSNSIKANDESQNYKPSKAPLSQQRSSNTGTDSGAVLSMKDLKAKYRA